jgi:hypothetical protein
LRFFEGHQYLPFPALASDFMNQIVSNSAAIERKRKGEKKHGVFLKPQNAIQEECGVR